MFSASDFKLDKDTLERYLRQAINEARVSGHVKFTNSGYTMSDSEFDRWDDAKAISKYVLAVPKHAKSIADTIFADVIGSVTSRNVNDMVDINNRTEFTSYGLTSRIRVWRVLQAIDCKFVASHELRNWLSSIGEFDDRNVWRSHWRDRYGQFTYEYAVRERNTPLIMLAMSLAQSRHARTLGCDDYQVGFNNDGSTDFWGALALSRIYQAYTSSKPSAKDIMSARADIMGYIPSTESVLSIEKRRVSQQNFVQYWGSLKQRISSISNMDECRNSFDSIQLQPRGTLSSRTWGIEVEHVDARNITRPAGWDRRHDGSLEPADDDYCDCSCEDCEEYESHCGYDSCADSDSCAEFVSPVLSHFNSAGLRSICDESVGTATNSTPGIHIHVGASDLTAVDVARLVVAYSAVSPFIWKLMKREHTGYCKDISPENISFWLADARNISKAKMLAESANHPRFRQDYQPDDRYHDLNLKSLSAHGTIEFRAMGPVYEYDYLVRWAWFCREMVNVAKIDIPQSTWTSVKSLSDVLNILYTYGSETIDVDNFYTKGDSLEVEESNEMEVSQF